MCPPGKTCAEGKAEEVTTRWSRRIWFVGEMRRILFVERETQGVGFSATCIFEKKRTPRHELAKVEKRKFLPPYRKL